MNQAEQYNVMGLPQEVMRNGMMRDEASVRDGLADFTDFGGLLRANGYSQADLLRGAKVLRQKLLRGGPGSGADLCHLLQLIDLLQLPEGDS